ncbi:grainyhead-like protein 1 homolog isoform X2 [Ostrea edulis]|uniref:grainyhead-like protein 1 homolog isoform X2 n=1 Tax=Ostrea edulis TaxID=37623 RepID=UPI00209551CE|nr:grainyhead-like protein 1 homolog isoform X2 [Ostrea edulis]
MSSDCSSIKETLNDNHSGENDNTQAESGGATDCSPKVSGGRTLYDDGPPNDPNGYFRHPLTAAETAISCEASALAYEYSKLPALDASGMKIGETNDYKDIIRANASPENGEVEESENESEFFTIGEKFLSQEIREVDEHPPPVDHVIEEVCKLEHHQVSQNQKRPKSTRSRGKKSSGRSKGPIGGMEDPCSASMKNGESVETPLITNQRIKNDKSTSPGKNSALYKGSPIAEDCRNFCEIEHCDNDPLFNCCTNTEKLEDQKESTNKIKKALHDKLRKNQSVQGNQDVLLNESPVTTSDSISSNGYSPGGVPVLETCELQPISVSTNSPTGSYSEEQTTLQESVAMSLGMPMACAATTHSNSISSLDITMHHTPEQCYSGLVDIRPNQILAGQSEQDLLHNNGIHHQTIRQNSYPVSSCHSSNYNNNGYIYPITPPQMNHSPQNNEIMERYLQQQQQQQQQQQPYHPEQSPSYGFYGVGMKDNYAMKSPDSGYQEPCLSPTDQMSIMYNQDTGSFGEVTTSSCQKVSKRRKSAPAVYQKPLWQTCDKIPSFGTIIPKLPDDSAEYKCILETPISSACRRDEDRVTYLNKGQYYGLTIEYNGNEIPQCGMVKSVIMVVFRDDKSVEDEQKAWEFWHSRQHSHKQRVIDIDTKDSQGVQACNITEVAYNAVALRWNPRDSPIKVNVAVHCLSTDFSNQKGVKGLPLHVQIDTYENPKESPVNRGYCQIKVFCDKGAERKTRDEERRLKTRQTSEGHHHGRKRNEDQYHPPSERSEFYSMQDTKSVPFLYTPSVDEDGHKRSEKSPSRLSLNGLDDDGNSSLNSLGDNFDDVMCPPFKKQRLDSYDSYQKVLLYVRERHESVFTALMLRQPTLHGFLQAVEEKYGIPTCNVKITYKRSKKGIIVKMDDNIVRHYSHESTFTIEMNKIGDSEDYEIILTEIDTVPTC